METFATPAELVISSWWPWFTFFLGLHYALSAFVSFGAMSRWLTGAGATGAVLCLFASVAHADVTLPADGLDVLGIFNAAMIWLGVLLMVVAGFWASVQAVESFRVWLSKSD